MERSDNLDTLRQHTIKEKVVVGDEVAKVGGDVWASRAEKGMVSKKTDFFV